MADHPHKIPVLYGFDPIQARQIKLGWARTDRMEAAIFHHNDEPFQSTLLTFHFDLPKLFEDEFSKVKSLPAQAPPSISDHKMTITTGKDVAQLHVLYMTTPTGEAIVFGIPIGTTVNFDATSGALFDVTFTPKTGPQLTYKIATATTLGAEGANPAEAIFTVDGRGGEFIRCKFVYDTVSHRYFLNLIGMYLPTSLASATLDKPISAKPGSDSVAIPGVEDTANEYWELEPLSIAADGAASALRFWWAAAPGTPKFEQELAHAKVLYFNAHKVLLDLTTYLKGFTKNTKTLYTDPAEVVGDLKIADLRAVRKKIRVAVDEYNKRRKAYFIRLQKGNRPLPVEHTEAAAQLNVLAGVLGAVLARERILNAELKELKK